MSLLIFERVLGSLSRSISLGIPPPPLARAITVDVNQTIGEAIEIMNNKNIRRLLVKEKKKYVGIITDKDIMNAC